METAVQVRSKRTGELRLVSSATDEQGLFFPAAEEQIVEVQRLIKLADYECTILVNASGELSFYYVRCPGAPEALQPGSTAALLRLVWHLRSPPSPLRALVTPRPAPVAPTQGDDSKRGEKPRAFFIPPHHQAYALTWSRGRRRERRDLKVERIDCRPMFMSFEFNTRTADNVELVLEGTFFWQVVDVEAMVSDPECALNPMRPNRLDRHHLASHPIPTADGRMDSCGLVGQDDGRHDG